jgi:hypothetical protein
LQNMFATGSLTRSSVSSPASSMLMFPAISIFATIAQLFATTLSEESLGSVRRAQHLSIISWVNTPLLD